MTEIQRKGVKISFNDENKLDGIINYMKKQSNGNILNLINITASKEESPSSFTWKTSFYMKMTRNIHTQLMLQTRGFALISRSIELFQLTTQLDHLMMRIIIWKTGSLRDHQTTVRGRNLMNNRTAVWQTGKKLFTLFQSQTRIVKNTDMLGYVQLVQTGMEIISWTFLHLNFMELSFKTFLYIN